MRPERNRAWPWRYRILVGVWRVLVAMWMIATKQPRRIDQVTPRLRGIVLGCVGRSRTNTHE